MRLRIILLIVSGGLSFYGMTQRVADLGIRFNTADYNRIQLEFRKPFGENYYSRVGVSMGFQFNYPGKEIKSANDSVVTMRQKDIYGNHYDLRFGIERKISYDWLSFHADLIGAFSSITNNNWNYYYVLDSAGTSWDFQHKNPYTGIQDTASTAINSIAGGGIALGLSFNFPITDNFMLNFSGNYTGMLRFAVGQKETNDVYDEFNFSKATSYEMYPSAGIGLRFVFDKKSDDTAPVEGLPE